MVLISVDLVVLGCACRGGERSFVFVSNIETVGWSWSGGCCDHYGDLAGVPRCRVKTILISLRRKEWYVKTDPKEGQAGVEQPRMKFSSHDQDTTRLFWFCGRDV